MSINSYKDLLIWQKGIRIVILVYKLVKNFPEDERFALTSQLKRASVSIPVNIAEGAARKSPKEFRQFLYISLGSLSELDTKFKDEKLLT